MSRIKISESPAPLFDEDLYGASPGPEYPRRTAHNQALSPSPVTSTSSDKENRSSRTATDKVKARALNTSMGPPKVPSPATKRKRTETTDEGDDLTERNQRRRTIEVDEDDQEEEEEGQEYDPDQSVEERRQLRFELRTLSRTLQDNRAEYLHAESTGIKDTLLKANQLSERVKQTSDATIDSRLLVNTADLAKKKTLQMTCGDTSQGVDVDDFVSKIKLYMRAGARREASQGHALRSTQRSRRNGAIDDEDSENDNDGEMLNWEHLGRNACLPNNSRPSVPGFLLGPLSLQKRARRALVRKAALKPSNLQETHPEVLKADDIEKSENANLTYLCTKIQAKLRAIQEKSIVAAEEVITEEMTEEERRKALRDQFDMSETSSIAYFKFVINPFSFGQTIENMFYVSFLVRDGTVEIDIDPDGLPYIGTKEPDGNKVSSHTARHQAVLSLDMHDWREMIELFDIKEPMIDHREEQDNSNIGAKGWYA